MKAVVATSYGSPDVLQLREVAKPVPRDNEVLIKNHATVVTPADCAARKGSPRLIRLFTGLRRPRKAILGSEIAGIVEAVGNKVARFIAGDQVFGATGIAFGAYAEYICLPETGALAKLPTGVPFEAAVAICDGALTALPFLRDQAKIRSGQRILINGASGAVGTAAVQLARHYGAHITGVCSTANLELVRSLGADEVIDYSTQDFTATGQTFDIIFDTVGKKTFTECEGALNPGGVYLTTILSSAIIPQMLWTSRIGNKRSIIAFAGLRSTFDKGRDLHILNGLLEEGKLRAVIDRRYRLEEAAEAHRYVETGHKQGSVVMTP